MCLCVPMYVCTCALECRCQYQESSSVSLPPYLLDKGSQSDQELTNTVLQPAYFGDLLSLLEIQSDGHTHPKCTWVMRSPNSWPSALWYLHLYGKLICCAISPGSQRKNFRCYHSICYIIKAMVMLLSLIWPIILYICMEISQHIPRMQTITFFPLEIKLGKC